MSAMASQITGISIIFSTFFQAQIKENIKVLAVTGFCEGTSPVTGGFPHKGPLTRKMFPFDDVIMVNCALLSFVLGTRINSSTVVRL